MGRSSTPHFDAESKAREAGASGTGGRSGPHAVTRLPQPPRPRSPLKAPYPESESPSYEAQLVEPQLGETQAAPPIQPALLEGLSEEAAWEPVPLASGAGEVASSLFEFGVGDESEDSTPTGTSFPVPQSLVSELSESPAERALPSRPTQSAGWEGAAGWQEAAGQAVDEPAGERPTLPPLRGSAPAQFPPLVHPVPGEARTYPLVRRAAREQTLPPGALFRPHQRVAWRLARDVRSSKREIVIGLTIGLSLAIPLFLVGHDYLERTAPTALERAPLPGPAAPRPASARSPRLERAVAGLEPVPVPARHAALTTAAESLGPTSGTGAEHEMAPGGSAELEAARELGLGSGAAGEAPRAELGREPSASKLASRKSSRRRAKPAAASATTPPEPGPLEEQSPVAAPRAPEEGELSPAQRAGLGTTLPF